MYVCTGHIKIGKRVYKLGEPVPVADWPVYAIRNEVNLGNLRDVDHEEAAELLEMGQRQEEAENRKMLAHRVAAAQSAAASARALADQIAHDLESAKEALAKAEDTQLELESEFEELGPEPEPEQPVVIEDGESDIEIIEKALKSMRKPMLVEFGLNIFDLELSGNKADMIQAISDALATGDKMNLDEFLLVVEDYKASDG